MDKIEQAKRYKEEGKSLREIGGMLNVSKSTVANWLKINTVEKGWINPSWQTVGGEDTRPVDLYGAVPSPDPKDLLACYEDTVYICATWLSDTVSSVPLKSYVLTHPGQRQPKCLTRPIRTKSAGLQHVGNHVDTREVLEHPFKELIDNPYPNLTRNDLLRLIDLDLSLAGNSYVYKRREVHEPHANQDVNEGLPVGLCPLDPAKIKQATDQRGLHVGYWFEEVNSAKFIPRDDVIHFKLINPSNRYADGISPVRGMYERILLGKSEKAYLLSLYRNQARPDSIGMVKGGTTPAQIERLQKEHNQRFSKGGIGGVMYVDADEIDYKPLGWAPKDMLGVDLYKYNRLQIINAFGLNEALFDSSSSNRATADTARYTAMLNGVLPRLRAVEEKINADLAPEFDERLFVAFDNPVPEDRQEDLNEQIQLLGAGVITKDEIRQWRGLPEEGNHNDPEDDNLKAAQQVLALQTAFYEKKLPKEAAIANAMVIGFPQDEAERLFPDMPQEAAPQPPQPPIPGQDAPAANQPQEAPGEAPQFPLKSVGKCGGEGGTPGPCKENRPDQNGNDVHAAARGKVSRTLTSSLDSNANLNDAQKAEYKAGVEHVVKQLHPNALKRLYTSVDKTNFYPTTSSMTQAVLDENPKLKAKLPPGYAIKGAYDKNRKHLHLDGADTLEGKPLPVVQSQAHEMTHALDGPKAEISNSPEWEEAFNAEIKGGQITKYAAASKAEGMAEFGRLLFASGKSHSDIQQAFPKSFAVFKGRELI